jgi:hypothetical protein
MAFRITASTANVNAYRLNVLALPTSQTPKNPKNRLFIRPIQDNPRSSNVNIR